MTHEIKIKESFANAVLRGDKTFEIRFNDRGYQRGDSVRFIVIDDSEYPVVIPHPLSGEYYEITYVMNGWGLKEGYCAFGIKRWDE